MNEWINKWMNDLMNEWKKVECGNKDRRNKRIRKMQYFYKAFFWELPFWECPWLTSNGNEKKSKWWGIGEALSHINEKGKFEDLIWRDEGIEEGDLYGRRECGTAKTESGSMAIKQNELLDPLRACFWWQRSLFFQLDAFIMWTHIYEFHCPMKGWAKWVSEPVNRVS